MKKLLILVIAFLLIGCESKTKKIENTMLEYAKTYYNDYMTASNLDVAEITINMLETANKEANANFDLSKLSKCTKESKIELTIEKGTRNILEHTFDLNCSK